MVIAIHLIIVLSFAFLIYRKSKGGLYRYFWFALILKLGCGMALGWYYWHIAERGDTFYYDKEAIKYTQLFHREPVDYLKSLAGNEPDEFLESLEYRNQPRALIFTRILSVFYLVSFNNYWASGLYFSFFSFLGLWLMTTTLIRLDQRYKWPSLIAFLFFPSVVFWSSGVIKEAILMGCIGFIMHLSLKTWSRIHSSRVLLLLPLIFLLWFLKYYIAAVFIPAWLVILAGSLADSGMISRRLLKFAVYSLPVIFLLITFLHPNLNLARVGEIIWESHSRIIEMSEGNHYLELNTDGGPLILLSIPRLIFLGWFGPLSIFDSVATRIASIENWILLLLFIWFLLKERDFSVHGRAWLILPLAGFILISTILISLSTPVYGTLLRYRIAYTGFLIWLLMINHPLNKYLMKKFPDN